MSAFPRIEAIGRRSAFRAGGWLSLAFRPRTVLRASLVLLAIAAVVTTVLQLGSYEIAPGRVLATIFDPSGAAPDERLIVWDFRIPRVLVGVLVGAMLGVAGALIQSVTRNGLADPGLIGVTEGAAVVVLFLTVANPGISVHWYPPLGMLGSVATAAVVLALTRRVESIRFILIGVGVSAFLGAGISLFLTYGEITQVGAALLWMSGSLIPSSWRVLAMILPWAVAGLGAAIIFARAADAGLLGDAAATGLGVRTRLLRLGLIGGSFALVASVVAIVGPVGFIGLIGPHLARFIMPGGQASLVAGSALCGATLLLVADSIGRLLIAPIQIPAGIVMAIVGVPFFLWLLWRRRHAL